MKVCKICKKTEATIPDRNRPGSRRKDVKPKQLETAKEMMRRNNE